MNRRTLFLSFVCALALLFVPASYSWAQSQDTESQQQQQQPADQQNQSNQDINRDSSQDANRDLERETPSQAGESGEELPATAGELPLLGLLGVLSIAAALGTRSYVRARSTR